MREADGAVFVQWSARETVGQQSVRPPPEANGNVLFAADVRLDNRAELGSALGLAPQELAHTPDSALLFRAHQRWGDSGIARCLGAFVFALWEPAARRLTLARDCLGNRALFFHRGRSHVAFATTLDGLLALPDVPREIDEMAVANFLALNLGERRRTFYRGVERVPTRTKVTMDPNEIRHRTYWSPNLDAPPPYRRDEDYVERARELFDQAVAAAAADTPHVAVSLSGGLDSSAIAATVARLGQAERITGYTLVPPLGTQIDVGPMHYLDERDKVTALAGMYPRLEPQFITDEIPHPFEQDATRQFVRTSVPALAAANLGAFAYINDAVAAAGHPALLVGSAGNFGLTWGGLFSLPASLRSGHWLTFGRDLAALARAGRRGLLRTTGGEVVMRAAPESIVRLIHRLRGRDPDSVARFSALNPTFIAEHGLARQWREQDFHPSARAQPSRDPVRLRVHHMFDRNQFNRDNAAGNSSFFGFEIRDPHADRRLLEFLLQVPEPMYRRNGVPRSFARAVLADRLPPEILEERRRGRQGVSWFKRLSSRRQDVAADLERLDASPLARRLIDVPRLKQLMAQWPKDANEAEDRVYEYRLILSRGVHVGNFIRWVEGGNA